MFLEDTPWRCKEGRYGGCVGAKVDSPLSPEELVQLVDVSVMSKYGADLTQFTCGIAEDMRLRGNA
jgi:hypothetical protein